MKQYNFTLTGITPLIMHHNNIEARDELERRRKKTKGKPGDDRTPADTWKTYLYTSEDSGNVCLPLENLMAMLLEAGKKVPSGVKPRETLKSYTPLITFDNLDYDIEIGEGLVSRASVEAIDGEFSEHVAAARDLGFKLSVRSVRVGSSAHVRVRPMFASWRIRGGFEVEDTEAQALSLDNLQHLWEIAGRRIGLGDWRPGAAKPGRFGRFLAKVERG